MTQNRFDTYDGGAKIADYTDLMKQRHQEWDQRDENVEAQRKRNDQQRIANANQTKNLVNQFLEFAPTAAKHIKEHGDRRENRLRNELANELSKYPVSPLVAKARFEGLDKEASEHAYRDTIASRIEQAGTVNGIVDPNAQAFANRVRDLSSYDTKLLKQGWLNNNARNLIPKFKQALAAGELNHIKIGENTFASAAQTGDYATNKALLREYLVQHGLDPVNWANDDFLKEEFWPIYEKAEAAWLKDRQTTANAEWNTNKKKEYSEAIINVALNKPEQLASSMMELSRNNANFFGTQKEGFKFLKESLFQEVKDGKLPIAVVAELPDRTFLHDGQQGREVSLSENYPDEFEDWDEQVKDLQKNANAAKKTRDTLDQEAFIYTMNQEIKAMEGPITEEYKFQKVLQFRQQHQNIPIPEGLKTLLTAEKGDDYLLEMDLNAKRKLGIPITDAEINSFTDQNKVNLWKGFQKDGLLTGIDSDTMGVATGIIDSYVGDRFYNERNSTQKSADFRTVQYNAKKYFKQAYLEQLKTQPSKAKALEAALALTESQVQNQTWGLTLGSVADPNITYKQNLQTAERSISTNKNIITTDIIPGTEDTFKQVVKDIQAGTFKEIPLLYHQLARGQRGVTALDILNAQLESQKLPPVSGGTMYELLKSLGLAWPSKAGNEARGTIRRQQEGGNWQQSTGPLATAIDS